MSVLPARIQRSSHRARVIGMIAASAIVGAGLAIPALAGSTPTAVPVSQTQFSDGLAFQMPSPAALRASGRLAFAHYMPSLPVSIDNKPADSDYYTTQYLNPDGESGKHRAYGGFVRDRPLGRSALAGDYKLEDARAEVRQAMAAGLDGFSMDLLALKGTSALYATELRLMQAAADVSPDFKVMLVPDMSGSATRTAAEWAATVAALGTYSSAYRLADGRLVVSPFNAEIHDVTWWTQFTTIMSTTYAMPVAMLPMFLNEQNQLDAWSSLAWGISNWGGRNPAANNPDNTSSTGPLARAQKVIASGKVWMQPISVQDERPRSGIFDEAANTQNLRNTWQIATASGAQLVQLATWNDYVEGTSFAPSASHGWSFLDINAYYLAKWKTGVAPTIVRDTAYLTHRKQPFAAKPSYPQTLLMQQRPGTAARDTVEALTFLTAPATVTITVGTEVTTCAAAAGPSSCLAPLGIGTPRVTVQRNGAVVADAVSDNAVTTTPYVQDLQYVATSSARSRSGAVIAPPAAPVAPAVAPTTSAPPTATAPAAPTAVAGSNDSPSTATLTWDAPVSDGGSPVTGYRVARDGTDTGATGPWSTTLPATARSQSFTYLVAGATYTLSVQAMNAYGTGVAAQTSVTIRVPTPSAPGGITAGTLNDTATVGWTAPADPGSSPITGYRIRRFDGLSGTLQATTTVAAGDRSFTATGLAYGSPYAFDVTATNASGLGTPSARSASVIPSTVPGQPLIGTAVAGTNGGSVTATAAWLPPAGSGGSPVSGYVVTAYRLGTNGSVLATTTSAVQGATTRSLVMILPVSGTYRFTVQALSNAGAGQPSASSNKVKGR